MMRRACQIVTLVLATAMSVAVVSAAPILTPPDLNPGDMYHLAFVSSTLRDATSFNLADYDAHVQAAADAAGIGAASPLGIITWRAFGSTEAEDALTHLNFIAGPVYRLDGTRIADDATDLWDGMLAATLNLNEFGNQFNEFPATGSFADGMPVNTELLGLALGNFVRLGNSSQTTSAWAAGGGELNTNLHPFYAFSSPLTAQLAVPEPSALLLRLCLGAVMTVARCVFTRTS